MSLARMHEKSSAQFEAMYRARRNVLSAPQGVSAYSFLIDATSRENSRVLPPVSAVPSHLPKFASVRLSIQP